jgi:hypothetical protein
MHGKGTLIYPNGERYEGSWVYGKRHGPGTYFYLDGGRYEGEWVDDRIQGREKAFMQMQTFMMVNGLMAALMALELSHMQTVINI